MAISDENTEIYQILLQKSEEAVFVIDQGRKIIFWNKGAENLWGYSSSETIGTSIEIYISNIAQDLNESSKKITVLQKGGAKQTGLLNISQIQKGGQTYSMAIVKEVFIQKESSNALNILKYSVDNSFARVEFDHKGNILNLNQNFATLLEYKTTQELIKKHQTRFVPNEELLSKEYIEFWARLRKGIIQKGEYRRISKNNKEVWIQAVYIPFKNRQGKVVKVINLAVDITSQKKALLNVKGLKYAIDISFAQVEFSKKGKILDVNQEFVEILGYSTPEDLIGKHHSQFIGEKHDDPEKKLEELNEYALFWRNLEDGIIQSGEFKQINKNGEPIWTKAVYTPIKNSFGEVVKIIQIAVNITDQKQMVLNMQGLRDTIDVSYAQIEFDAKGNILDANQNFVDILKYNTSENLIGKHHAIFVDSAYKNTQEYVAFWEDLANGISKQGEFMRMTEEGNIVWLSATYTPVKDLDGNIIKVIQIASDISAQKQVIAKINKVIRLAGTEGRLDTRLELENVKGDWKKLGTSVNLLLESVANPVIEINRVVEQMAQGNFLERFEMKAEGNIKELGNSLNSAIDSLNILLGQIAEVGNLVAFSAKEMLEKGEDMKMTTEEVAAATIQMAQGAMNQAKETDEASQLMNDVLKSSNDMADKSVRINEAASYGQKNSIEGLKSIKSVGDNMDEIQKSAANTTDSILILSDRSDEISLALRVITDIAAQTNLLALNAAIEAARAGDSGRGFAVVAEEIRKLAEGSRKSAIDIEKVIREVQKDIITVAEAIETMSFNVQSGSLASKEAEAVLGNIEKANNETLDLSKEILDATVKQITSISTSVKNIENIVIVAEEIASGAEEVAISGNILSEGMGEVGQTSKSLAKAATQLQKSISKFKLKV